MTSADRIKDQQRKHWNIVADGWAAWLEWIEPNFAPVTEWLREAACWKPGAHVLDVACGAGYPMTVECASVAEYCQIFADVAWKARIAALSDADAARFREAVAKAAEPFINGGRIHLVATSLCASGRK